MHTDNTERGDHVIMTIIIIIIILVRSIELIISTLL